jgi:hypothetical protein
VANKGLKCYVKWKSAQGKENRGFVEASFAVKSGSCNEHGARGYTPPGSLHEYQRKGLAKFAIRKWLKIQEEDVGGQKLEERDRESERDLAGPGGGGG